MPSPLESSSNAASPDSQRRAVRIRRVIEDCMTRRANGELMSDDDVVSSHADLMPELREELSLLSMMERARRIAQSGTSDVDVGRPLPDAGDVPRLLDVRGYTIERELHRGGQGVVYEATQRSTGRKVAIKVLHEFDAADAHIAARFEREARVLAMIDHPHVVKVIDTGVVGGRRYIAMDLVRGVPWTEFERVAKGIDRGDQRTAPSERPDCRRSLERFILVCEAVHAAHLRGIIHRDLKPGNILIDADGRPHVLDFGLAKLTEAADSGVVSMTREGQFVGSLPWASPEQASGNAEHLDIRTDVYSLGVVLFQILTGAFPYTVQGPWRNVARTIAEAPPAKLRSLRSDLDIDVEKILSKCLAKEPEHRYQSAGALADDVRRYLAGEPVSARGGGTAYVLRRLARRHRFAVGAAAIMLLMVIAVAITTTVLYQRERRASERADHELRQADAARMTAEAARRKAELETEKATAVEAFLRGIFSGADPRRMGKDITVVELLDRASASEAYFDVVKHKPLVEAAVREAMGETYCGLGMAEAGAREFRAALELHRAAGGETTPDAIMTMHSLGTALWMLGQLDEAQDVVEQAMAASGISESAEINDEATAELVSLYNFILSARGNFKNIVANARMRLDYYERTFGREDWRTVYAMSDLSYAYDCTGRFEEAVTLCREALDLARAVKGPDDPLTLNIASNLASGLQKLNRTDEIEAIVRDVLSARRRTLPADHPAIAESLTQLAEFCGSQKDVDCAREAIAEALAIQIKTLGAAHWQVAGTRLRLASVYLHEKRFDDAASELIEAFEQLESVWCDHRQLTQTLGATILDLYRQWDKPEGLAEWQARLYELDCREIAAEAE